MFEDASSGFVETSTLSGNGTCGVYRNDSDAVELVDNTFFANGSLDVCQPN